MGNFNRLFTTRLEQVLDGALRQLEKSEAPPDVSRVAGVALVALQEGLAAAAQPHPMTHLDAFNIWVAKAAAAIPLMSEREVNDLLQYLATVEPMFPPAADVDDWDDLKRADPSLG
jgi:hypothetical protein